MQFGEFNMIAASDFLSNIFIFKDGQLYKTYLSAHAKVVTDIAWFYTFDETYFGSVVDSKLESKNIEAAS